MPAPISRLSSTSVLLPLLSINNTNHLLASIAALCSLFFDTAQQELSDGDNGQAGIFGFGEGGHLSGTWTEETSVARLLQVGRIYVKV